MRSIRRHFYSDGLRLEGELYLPEDAPAGARIPLIVACSGFTGLRKIHPERFARWFTQHGYACFGFDYRGYGRSEGTRRRVILEEQIRDIRSAVTVAAAESVADGRIFLLGWAMGGGLAVDAARELDELSGICAVNGLFDGPEFQRAHRGADGLAVLRRRVRAERLRRARTGTAKYVDPFDVYPLDEVTRKYVTSSLETVEGYESTTCSFELAECLLRWSVLPTAPHLRLPLLLIHGTHNALHPPQQAIDLARCYGGSVELSWLEGAGHTEWMYDEHPIFTALCDRIHVWLRARTS